MKMFDLTGRVVIVTGGNGGIGLGMAQGLAAAGATVSIWGRNPDKNATALASMAGGTCDAVVCDVADAHSVKAAFDATLKRYGRVDGCFANAGVGTGGLKPFIERTEQQWRTLYDTNLYGVFHVFQAAARHMMERAQAGDAFGRLVTTSSTAGLHGMAQAEHYAGSKAAVDIVVRSLAVELAGYGITVNSVLPGQVATDINKARRANPEFFERSVGRIPMRRFGEPTEFAGIAVYLMSGASSYHTADTIVIDGGRSAA